MRLLVSGIAYVYTCFIYCFTPPQNPLTDEPGLTKITRMEDPHAPVPISRSRLSPQPELRREQILQCAMRVTARVGAQAATAAAVAHEAHVSETTVFKYFPDKRSL